MGVVMAQALPEIQAEVSGQASENKERGEKRRHARHRYIERLYVRKTNGPWYTAMTYEISAGGLSAATHAELGVGERVKLSPVMDQMVEAIVRRKKGAMYGFEFLGMNSELQGKIEALCERLPVFQSLESA